MQFNNTCFVVAPVVLWVVFVSILVSSTCFAGPFAYVPGRYAWGGPMINKIDLKNGYKTTQMGIKAFPHSIFLHPDGSKAYLSAYNMDDEKNDKVVNTSVFDTNTGKYLQRFEGAGWTLGFNLVRKELYFSASDRLIIADLLDYSVKSELVLKGYPLLVISDRQAQIQNIKILHLYWTTDAIKKPRYGIFDTETNSNIDMPIDFAVEPAIERQGKKLFLAGLGVGKVYVADVDNPTQISVVDIGGYPLGGIAASTNSDEVFVVTSPPQSGANTDVVVLDSMTGAIIRRMRIPSAHAYTHMNTSEYFPDDLYIATQENFFVVDKVTGAVKFTLPNLQGKGGFYPSLALGTYVLDAPKSQIDANRLFNWAEDKYPQIFSSPQRPFSATAEGYYYRCYSGSNTCLGSRDGNVHFLPPGAGMAGITNLGPVGDYLPGADADGY